MASTVARTGLTEVEAAARLARYGPNALNKARPRTLAAIVGGTLREPMFMLLLLAAAIYLVIGDLGEGLFLTAGACLSIGLVIVQEARSERALTALRALAEPSARVLREGVVHRAPATELVPGDLVLVGEGERAPADARLVEGDVLSVDESVLTGESAPVAKTPGAAEPEAALLFAGTLIVRGQGLAEVTATGAATALGGIGASLARIVEEPTPLQRTSARLVGMMGVVAIGLSAVLALAYGLLRQEWVGGALAGVTLAISLIPEEFPMVLAVFMALGSWRLARHRVIVRKAAAIEALGGATVLCVDKTGTLTENRMQVVRLWADGRPIAVEAAAADPAGRSLVEAAARASATRSIDPMDRAVAACWAQVGGDGAAALPVRTWPVEPQRPALVQAWPEGGSGGWRLAAKGAPEAIFRLCRLTEAEAEALREPLEAMAAEGLRVLAAADSGALAWLPAEPEAAHFVFRGFLAFLDPLRADASPALEVARSAGMAVAMITGDYPSTALAIARQAGIDASGGVLTGEAIARLSPDALAEQVKSVRVFARVRPDEKLRLVEAFKANGEVVVMTGDGVNDAPALEAAHIGIAMGRRGTDVAREAADLVLLDDSFASIVGGVRLGRRIFANLRRALTFITAVHIPIAGLALAPIFAGLPPLLLPMHVVLLELVIDPVCSLAFEGERSDKDSMARPPRRRGEALFGPAQVMMAAVQGLLILAAVFGIYVWALQDASEQQARGVAYATLVLSVLFLAFANAVSISLSVFDRRRVVFWAIVAVTLTALETLLYVPRVAEIFQVEAPEPAQALAALCVAVAATAWVRLARGARAAPG
jgi:Ca2+-transporting ATPase